MIEVVNGASLFSFGIAKYSCCLSEEKKCKVLSRHATNYLRRVSIFDVISPSFTFVCIPILFTSLVMTYANLVEYLVKERNGQ